jgi:hypothetical protein
MNDPQSKTNAGIGAAVSGLILGIIALFGGIVVFFICTGWASFEGGLLGAVILGSLWTIFSLVSLILSLMGRKKMVKAGRSATLGIIGAVIGVLAVLLGAGIIGASYVANGAL